MSNTQCSVETAKVDELSNEEKETANAAAESSEKRTRHTAGPRRNRARHAAETAGKFVIQLAFLIGVCYIGNAIAAAIPLGIPGNIVSMVLLLGLLITGMLQATKIDLVSSFLLKYMPVFFIPAGVSVMGCFPMIADHLPQFALVVLLTTVLVFLVTSLTVTAVIKIQAKIAEKKGLEFDTSVPLSNEGAN